MMTGKMLYGMYAVFSSDVRHVQIPGWDDLSDNKKTVWNLLAQEVVLAPGARPPA